MMNSKWLLSAALGCSVITAGVVLGASSVMAAAAAPAPLPTVLATPGATTSFPTPKIAVIDRQAILRLSAVGKDIVAQMETLSKQSDQEFKSQEASLRTEAQTIQQQSAILSAEVRSQKERDFTNKQQAFQKRVQSRQGELQNAFNVAQRQVEQALGPVLQKLMQDRGANLLFDRNAVVFATIDIDITNDAIARLDQILPKVKVSLNGAAAPPAGPQPITTAAPKATAAPPSLRATSPATATKK